MVFLRSEDHILTDLKHDRWMGEVRRGYCHRKSMSVAVIGEHQHRRAPSIWGSHHWWLEWARQVGGSLYPLALLLYNSFKLNLNII
ncbi:hypothetical protein HanRHA438_Chr14g0653441 [Helianthus annuus]|nr:hypothetical protein HanRHA438_Chr14g0653441 [Helianthus annuus]